MKIQAHVKWEYQNEIWTIDDKFYMGASRHNKKHFCLAIDKHHSLKVYDMFVWIICIPY